MDIFIVIFLVVSFLAALIDFLVYKIPNEIIISLLVLFCAKVLFQFGFDWSAFKTPLMVFGATLLVCIAFYAGKMLGAGDAKFIAVTSLWLVDYNVWLFFVFMALAGAVLALIYLKLQGPLEAARLFLTKKLSSIEAVKDYLEDNQVDPMKSSKGTPIPYGVAVFSGALLMLAFI